MKYTNFDKLFLTFLTQSALLTLFIITATAVYLFILYQTFNHNMREEELAANCVDAKAILTKLLAELDLSQSELATALSINYQRIYDLGSGRTKKFNPGMVRLITKVFPNVNPNFLYTGNGDVLLANDNSVPNSSGWAELLSMSKRLLQMMERLDLRDTELRERERKLAEREARISEREHDMYIKESVLVKAD
jgi:hypothetical protein